jgi:hypothetical protein
MRDSCLTAKLVAPLLLLLLDASAQLTQLRARQARARGYPVAVTHSRISWLATFAWP